MPFNFQFSFLESAKVKTAKPKKATTGTTFGAGPMVSAVPQVDKVPQVAEKQTFGSWSWRVQTYKKHKKNG